MPLHYYIYPLGDHAITIELGDRIDEATNKQCLELSELLSQSNIYGVKDIIPAYTTVSVIYDPIEIFQLPDVGSPYQYIRQITEQAIAYYKPSATANQRTITVPACFDVSFAPDLEEMAQQKNISAKEVIDIFLNTTYRVYMIGFLPGFAYMGKVDDAIASNRKAKPHTDIKAGSIGIAGNQTGIYPLNSPGGWNIIGRTPLRLFDKDADEPCLFKAGDEVVFSQIGIDEFHQLNQNT